MIMDSIQALYAKQFLVALETCIMHNMIISFVQTQAQPYIFMEINLTRKFEEIKAMALL